MDLNRMANVSLDELQDNALTVAQVLQSNPEQAVLAATLVLKLLEELGVADISELYIIAENALVDLNATDCEKFNALKMYIENDLI